jgi:RNA-directed DNA polymerase
MRAVSHHTDLPWVLLYVRRWLAAPMQYLDGTQTARDRGSPQGSAISPLLANLFMHYAFDAWMARTYPGVTFERYCDDVVVHCRSKAQADAVRDAIGVRMEEVGLQLHPDKTRVVYCKDSNRKGSAEFEQFTFLGYEFRPRLAKGAKDGVFFVSFSPAVSRDALTRIRHTIRGWRIHRRSDLTFSEIVTRINRYVAGWIAYYGRFYKSALYVALRGINNYLMRWAKRKFKHLRRSSKRAWAALKSIYDRQPGMFAHWKFGVAPT